MKLLVEVNEELKVIEEATDSGTGKNLYIQGPFMQADVVNRNRRLYPSDVMNPAVDNYIKEYVDTNRAVGELSHPNTHTLNPDRISHRIVKLYREGRDIMGKALITKTPCGDIVKGLIESGVKIGVSSRCLGSMREDSKVMPGKTVNIVERMKIVTAADIVMDPSAPDAWVNTLNEQKEWVMNEHGLIIEREILPILENSIDRATRDERKVKAFMTFIRKVGNTPASK